MDLLSTNCPEKFQLDHGAELLTQNTSLDFSSIFRRLSPTSTWWPVSLETWGAEDYSGLREQWRTPQNAALNADEEVFAVRGGRHETHAGRWCSARRDKT